jgi:hypothetical protein
MNPCLAIAVIVFLAIGLSCTAITIVGIVQVKGIDCFLVNKSYDSFSDPGTCGQNLWQFSYLVSLEMSTEKLFKLCTGASIKSQGCAGGSIKKGPNVCNPILANSLDDYDQMVLGSQLTCYQFENSIFQYDPRQQTYATFLAGCCFLVLSVCSVILYAALLCRGGKCDCQCCMKWKTCICCSTGSDRFLN